MRVRNVVAAAIGVAAIAIVGTIGVGKLSLVGAPVTYTFNWNGQPTSPQPWVPGSVNDWDMLASNDMPNTTAGTMQAGHGTDCSAPPATHQIKNLSDSVYICKDHMMTAVYGGGDADKTYAAVYFTPAQMVDFTNGTAQVNWQVSTQRTAARDWWDLWITPFNENEVVPLGNLPAFNGPPKDAIHFQVDNTQCNHNQAMGFASLVFEEEYNNFQPTQSQSTGQCIEDAVGGASATTRSAFELDITQGHVRLWMPGSNATLVDTATTTSFTKAVVTWGHHSYNPLKDCPGTCAPNTFHWSNVSITPSIPFTMLRPNGTSPVHGGANPIMTLPQPAPDGSFLRFAALGNIQVSLDGGPLQNAVRQAQDGPASDGIIHEEQNSNYWMPIPAGTKTIQFQGSANSLAPTWWASDVSVWSQSLLSDVNPTDTPSPTATPTPSPTASPQPTDTPTATPTAVPTSTATPTPTATPIPTPQPTPQPTGTPINNVQCVVLMPDGTLQLGTCSGTFMR